jgi:hypothetical protein
LWSQAEVAEEENSPEAVVPVVLELVQDYQ